MAECFNKRFWPAKAVHISLSEALLDFSCVHPSCHKGLRLECKEGFLSAQEDLLRILRHFYSFAMWLPANVAAMRPNSGQLLHEPLTFGVRASAALSEQGIRA